MRIGISLALSALVSQVVCAEVCPSTALVRQSDDLTVNKNTTCEISTEKKVKTKVENSGTIIFKSGGKITFENGGTLSVTSPGGYGKILVQNNATIDASATTTTGVTTLQDASTGNTLSIEAQDITVSDGKTLTLKAETITLGGSDNSKHTKIVGGSSILTNTSSKNVILETTTTLNTKDLILESTRIDGGSTLTTLTNTKLELNGGFITSNSTSGLTLKSDSSTSSTSSTNNGITSSFILKGKNNKISTGNYDLKVEGTHSFSGSGILDFTAGTGTITLGGDETAKLTLKQEESSTDTPTLGFQANKVLFKNLQSSDLTLQVINGGNATISNINTTFKGGTLQALDTSEKDNVLVIENGNTDTNVHVGGISVLGGGSNTTTTFLGTDISIYGQVIAIGKTAEPAETTGSSIAFLADNPATLVLKTTEDSGNITLGRKAGDLTYNELIQISGQNSTTSNLQLRSQTVTFGGNVTIQNLNIQTQSSNEGMVFAGEEGSVLTLSDVTITSGIADEGGNQKYQSLSLTSDSKGTILVGEANSVVTISSNASTTATLKASSLFFENQDISLANAGSGGSLNLYSYGDVALSDKNGSGVGNFAFRDTTITDGSGATLNLYSVVNAKVLASGLTLNNVTLTTYAINGSSSNKNALDLSHLGSDFTTQGSVTIDTKKFIYGSTQGIGMNITIEGGDQGNGKLTLKSEENGESFTFGGTLTIDNSSATSGTPNGSDSQIVVDLGTTQNGVQTQSSNNQNVNLFINGGLTAIGNATSGSTTTLTAKSFTFGANSVVSSINGTLSLSANDNGGNIDISQALTVLQGVSTAEATISKGTGTLTLGDVIATGKTKITDATFKDSDITITSLGSGADTLTVTSDSEVSEIASIDIADSNFVVATTNHTAQPILIDQVAQATTPQALKLNSNATITSNGTSTITASTITAGDSGTYSIHVESGTLTLSETADTGSAIGTLTLGSENDQGGNLILLNVLSNHHDFKAPKIVAYNNSSITASSFIFDIGGADISSSKGELKLLSKENMETLLIKYGKITLDNGSLSYYYTNSSKEQLGKIKLFNGVETISITSKGTSSIQASELSLSGNTITSSGGMLTLKGLSSSSTLGVVTINNAGGLTATDANGSTATDIKLGSTLTLTANTPYTSSSSPLGGGKFGVLQAKKVIFSQSGGADNPLVFIKVLDKPLEGEELFTLQEGGQIVVQSTEGITKGNTTAKTGQAITLEDISLDNGDYKSLSLSAELIPDSTKETQVNAIKVLLSVAQSSASEIAEGISDSTAKVQMQTILSQGDNQAIIDSILGSSSNPLKVGFAENIAQGNVVVVGNALNYIVDTFASLAGSIHLNDRVQTQIYLSQTSIIEGRMARHNNPHQSQSQLARFIRSYHNTAYASSDDELLAPEDETTSLQNALWVSYDGGLATGNGSNSTINGVSAGYDHSIGTSSLLGGFVSYAYGIFDGDFLHNTSHNVGFGLYSRVVVGGNELDLTLSENIALITSEVDVGNTTMPSLLNGVADYKLYRTNFMARYGYSFKVGDEESPYYLKPLVGMSMAYTYQEGIATEAIASITTNELSLFKLDVSAGMEMRKYINEGTYFFLMPLVEREIYGSSCDVNVGFVDSANLSYSLDYQSQTSIALYAGGEGNLTENLALNGSVGVKVGIEKSEVLTNWSVGLKYKF